ncbi:hypothetical protein [Polaribacter sp. Z022]|uniref:hypothetical protein n=1 Tax=Polaribacter sp. Z022 TaxID=2927125 RepID=UPI0020201360|nr:hypothetical protein [Polaribacter sp. Z022]MCL7752233.1 hypothetical protein [Polaribacter sp. Z022]
MKKFVFLLLTLFVSSFCFSQNAETTNNNFLPISIYTSSFKVNTNNIASYASIKKNLNFPDLYNFASVSFEELDSHKFLIIDNNFGIKPTKFIYDDYKSYRDENLLKGFFQKYDLTRWQPCNIIPPRVN